MVEGGSIVNQYFGPQGFGYVCRKLPNLKMQYFDDVMTSSHVHSAWHQSQQRAKVVLPGSNVATQVDQG